MSAGCCGSRQVEDVAPEPIQPRASILTHNHNSSTRAIAQSAVPPSTTIQSRSSQTRSLRPQASLTTTTSTPRGSTYPQEPEPFNPEQPNAPLKRHPPWSSKRRTWTPSQLARERYEFFETRVTGNAEVWAALKIATELMREDQLPTAQEILNAAGVTIPSGDLREGAFDVTGNLYKIPAEILEDPVNIVNETEADPDSHGRSANSFAIEVDDKELDDFKGQDESAEVLARREEKGKGNERDSVNLKCRLSDRGGPDIVISLSKSQPVGVLARRISNQAGISRSSRIRIAYFGKILNESDTLVAQGWREGHVVNALVVPNPQSDGGLDAARGGGD